MAKMMIPTSFLDENLGEWEVVPNLTYCPNCANVTKLDSPNTVEVHKGQRVILTRVLCNEVVPVANFVALECYPHALDQFGSESVNQYHQKSQ